MTVIFKSCETHMGRWRGGCAILSTWDLQQGVCPLPIVWLPAVMWALVVKFHMDSWALLSDLQI